MEKRGGGVPGAESPQRSGPASLARTEVNWLPGPGLHELVGEAAARLAGGPLRPSTRARKSNPLNPVFFF